MRVIREKHELRDLVARARSHGQTIGFVPTMGALHEGHLSLIQRAAAACDVVVVSIFVNPTQFGPSEDFGRYPRTLEADVDLLAPAGVAAVFAPSVEEMYGPALAESGGQSPTRTSITPGPVAQLWEGAQRPGHFDGVALIVSKLLSLVRPDLAYFGEKDYQQLCVIRELVEDLDLGVSIVGCPIRREPDGLAMSSRNRYLAEPQRKLAAEIYGSIEAAREIFGAGERDARAIERAVSSHLESSVGTDGSRIHIGYVAVVDGRTLEPATQASGSSRLLVSVEIGGTHLIDNAALA